MRATLFVTIILCSWVLLADAPAALPSAAPYKTDHVTVDAVLFVKQRRTRTREGFDVVMLLHLRQGKLLAYNTTMNEAIGRPARLLVYDENHQPVADLLEPSTRASRANPGDGAWVDLSPDYAVEGVEIHLWPYRYDRELLPPGKYFLQLVYTETLLQGPEAKLPEYSHTPEERERGIIMRSNVVPIELLPSPD